MGSQNGLFDQYLGNGKRYSPETKLYPHKSGHSTSVKVVQCSYVLPLNVIICVVIMVIELCITFGSQDIRILKFGAMRPKKVASSRYILDDFFGGLL